MSTESFRAKVATHFAQKWATAFPLVPVQYDNVKFKQPVDTPWVSFIVVNGDRYPTTIGKNAARRQEGIVNIAIMVPEETGTQDSNKMVDEVIKIFQELKITVSAFARASFFDTEVRMRGNISGYYTQNVMISFFHDQEKQS